MGEMYKLDGETDVENGQLKRQVSKIIDIFTRDIPILLFKHLSFLNLFKKNSPFHLKWTQD